MGTHSEAARRTCVVNDLHHRTRDVPLAPHGLHVLHSIFEEHTGNDDGTGGLRTSRGDGHNTNSPTVAHTGYNGLTYSTLGGAGTGLGVCEGAGDGDGVGAGAGTGLAGAGADTRVCSDGDGVGVGWESVPTGSDGAVSGFRSFPCWSGPDGGARAAGVAGSDGIGTVVGGCGAGGAAAGGGAALPFSPLL